MAIQDYVSTKNFYFGGCYKKGTQMEETLVVQKGETFKVTTPVDFLFKGHDYFSQFLASVIKLGMLELATPETPKVTAVAVDPVQATAKVEVTVPVKVETPIVIKSEPVVEAVKVEVPVEKIIEESNSGKTVAESVVSSSEINWESMSVSQKLKAVESLTKEQVEKFLGNEKTKNVIKALNIRKNFLTKES